MCGIVAVLRRAARRPLPSADELRAALAEAEAALQAAGLDDARPDTGGLDADQLAASLEVGARALGVLDRLLRGEPGVAALVRQPALAAELSSRLDRIGAQVAATERLLDERGATLGTDRLELLAAGLIALKDVHWATAQDRLRTARAVAELAGPLPGLGVVRGYLAIQETLSALDRLEVRGRDSAGLQVLVRHHGLQRSQAALADELAARADELFAGGAAAWAEDCLSFVYKAAAEIGELGDNTRAIRAAIQGDGLLRRALSGPAAEIVVLAHTRWASVGIISAANAHPLDAQEIDRRPGPYVTAALNGDVDNFADLKATHGLRIRSEITTDAKVIPTLTSRLLAEGLPLAEAFRRAVVQMDGSVAIAALAAPEPAKLLLALRGSGQALYVGLGEDLTMVASEPYGLVEVTERYLRLDGDTPADADNPAGSRGQVVVVDGTLAGTPESIRRRSYDGSELPLDASELVVPQITTRDIDRGEHPHYLLKEISESPGSFRKTLRGRLIEDPPGHLVVRLGPETLPAAVADDLASGAIAQVLVIGQGTAAVAGQGLVAALGALVPPGRLRCEAVLATELSGFRLRSDMADTLVIAISQSGTTTDTNRTVDLVRARGARVVSIVNRRQSDLVDRSDGVLYTSDGRDVEMSVASTKAFYAQIAAGWLLAVAIADRLGIPDDEARAELLAALRDLPALMTVTLARRDQAAEAARRFAPSRRYWAIVGNGPNRIAASEIRIKLSELCYKSIACDGTEDKKHIDLSSEPLVIVCASGLLGSTADDVAKEVGIYRAHSAAPVVIASEGTADVAAALAMIRVPDTHPLLGYVLATMVGHLFGYEAALAIDALAVPLRLARAAIEGAVSADDRYDLLYRLRVRLEPVVAGFFDGLRAGSYNGQLEASTAARLSSLLRYALGVLPLEAYQLEFGKVGTPAVVVDDLTRALTQGIDELTRPVDAIKHQAKTVTVGISRSDESLLETALVRSVMAAGAARDRLSYDVLRTLGALSPAVGEITGYTRYRIEGRPDDADATITVVDRGGISLDLPLRTEVNPRLRGTKHQVATSRRVLVTRGRADGRLLVIVPEVKDGQTTGITLLHVRFPVRLPVAMLRTVLAGYGGRYGALEDAVTETEPTFREDRLEAIPVADLLIDPISALADRWRV